MKSLLDLVRDQTIAVVGNAESILRHETGKEIDAHDIVIRMNLGMCDEHAPAHHDARRNSKSLGTRTDVWASAKFWPIMPAGVRLALFMKPEGLTHLGDQHWPRFQRWCESKDKPVIRWPMHLEVACREFVGADPGTGIRLVWWLVKHASPMRIGVYGFDFWQTNSTWTDRRNTPNHSPTLERLAMEKLLA